MNDAMRNADIYIQQESGKMIVTDIEEAEKAREARREKRKQEGYGVDSDTDSDDEGGSSLTQKGASARQLRKLMQSQKGNRGATSVLQRMQHSNQITKKKSLFQMQQAHKARATAGHFEKFSSSAYKSQKGKGDVLKAGKLEPFAYIQLNPRLLNKRHKQKAINSFSKVVSFGKKEDKRAGNASGQQSGALSGLKVVKK